MLEQVTVNAPLVPIARILGNVPVVLVCDYMYSFSCGVIYVGLLEMLVHDSALSHSLTHAVQLCGWLLPMLLVHGTAVWWQTGSRFILPRNKLINQKTATDRMVATH